MISANDKAGCLINLGIIGFFVLMTMYAGLCEYLEIPFYTIWIVLILGFVLYVIHKIIIYNLENYLADKFTKKYPNAARKFINTNNDSVIKSYSKIFAMLFRAKGEWMKEEQQQAAIVETERKIEERIKRIEKKKQEEAEENRKRKEEEEMIFKDVNGLILKCFDECNVILPTDVLNLVLSNYLRISSLKDDDIVVYYRDNWGLDKAKEFLKYKQQIVELNEINKKIAASVRWWRTIDGLPFYHFYTYYPSSYDEIDENANYARELIYQFKDGYRQKEIYRMVKAKLLKTFAQNVSRLTFVCVPASDRKGNEIRYKRFSEMLCNDLGMRNAFNHIHIKYEKIPRRLGGTEIPEYDFDEDFFAFAKVILFDDITTSGSSVRRLNNQLFHLGAKTICAMTLGKTYSPNKRNWQCVHPWLVESPDWINREQNRIVLY